MIVALVTRKKKKGKNKTQANITFKAGSGHFLLFPAKAGDAIFDTEAGGPHHWLLQILQTVVFKTMQVFFASFLIPQGVVGMEVIHPLLPLRWPLGSGFLVSLAKILEPISREAEHQAGSRDPGSML